MATGIPLPARGLLLSNYLHEWLEVMRSRLRPKTFDAYQLCLQRVDRTLGAVPVARISPQLIQHAYTELLARGLSPRIVFHTHAVLHRALKRARQWGLIAGIPTKLVAAPRAPYREMRVLSAVQLETLFESSRLSRWNPL
jgi:integrase